MASFYQKGDRILDRYEVETFAGGGGVGEVYRCRMGGDVFALKVLNPRVVGSFLTETRLREALESDRPDSDVLAAVRDIEQDDNRFFVVSDWIDGWDLRRAMTARTDAGGRFTIEETFVLVDALLEELASWPSFAVHGALKPENILVEGVQSDVWTSHVAPRITDYGLRRVVSFSKYASVALTRGKPFRYLAPEFVGTGGDIDRRADVYSVAALAYELLTGEAPRKEPAPVSSFGAHIPEALDAIFARALASAADRYPNAGELREAFRTAVPAIHRHTEDRPVEVGSIDLFSGELTESVRVRVEDLDAVDVFAVEPSEVPAASPLAAAPSGGNRDLIDMERAFDQALSPESEPPTGAEPAPSAESDEVAVFDDAAGSGVTNAEPEAAGSSGSTEPQGESKLLVYLLVAAATLALVFLLLRYRQAATGQAPVAPPPVVGTPMATPVTTPEPTPAATPEPTPAASPTTASTSTSTSSPTTTAAPTPAPTPAPAPEPSAPPAEPASGTTAP